MNICFITRNISTIVVPYRLTEENEILFCPENHGILWINFTLFFFFIRFLILISNWNNLSKSCFCLLAIA